MNFSMDSVKVITAWDTLLTLAVEHVGMSFHLPVYHPVIIGPVIGGTYILFKHKDRISDFTLRTMKHAKKGAKTLLVRKVTCLEDLQN